MGMKPTPEEVLAEFDTYPDWKFNQTEGYRLLEALREALMERNEARDDLRTANDHYAALELECEKLGRERDEARAALEFIVWVDDVDERDKRELLGKAFDKARKALQKGDGEK